jgi:sarcosine oxidase
VLTFAGVKVAVIGLGATGCAAAWRLALEGHAVVGFEQLAVGHDRGSSHGPSRIIRHAYRQAHYTRMMRDAFPLWDELERESGEELFVRCGSLYLGSGAGVVREVEQALRVNGVAHERLSARETSRRHPALAMKPGEIALWQADGGFLRATRCVNALARLARANGAELRDTCRVEEIAERAGRPTVQTEAGSEGFDAAIVTAGAWMGRLLSGAALPLRVTRQWTFHLRIARRAESFAPGRLPVWIDADTHHYGFPADAEVEGVKVAIHVPGPVVDPDRSTRREGRASAERAVVDLTRRRLPDLTSDVAHATPCLYTSTPDEAFVIDSAPGLRRTWLVSGCSGHGFKFAALFGRIAADLVSGRQTGLDLQPFSASRFSRS